jgi:predicted CxxxxCH...CXXCH cytochrome family protein
MLVHRSFRSSAAAGVLGLAALAAACTRDREAPAAPPTYDSDVASVLTARCTACHSRAAPAAGWSATSFLGAVACVMPSGAPATLPADATAPLLRALDAPPHQGLVSAREGALLVAWIAAGTPAFDGTVHAPSVVDPRAVEWHGAVLRARRWFPALDGNASDACGRCHDGAPRPPGVTLPAPGAASCTSCHDGAQGFLACSTCHGNGARAYPPRDPCFFPGDSARAGSHAAHVEPSGAGLSCATCHPMPGPGVIGGTHGNGSVEVIFDPTAVRPEASYDRTTGVCAVSCHDQGGARARPRWNETVPMSCGDCHGSPPARHYPGACTTCHREANADGTALTPGPLHMNGKVDLGDGSGTCGACHGAGDDPWPRTAAHPRHETQAITTPIECTNCHVVPDSVLAPGHLDGVVRIAFSGRALARGALPAYDGSSCRDVACHGANLREPPAVVPSWMDTSGAASACGACHGAPPVNHTASTSCDRSTCHGTEVSRSVQGVLGITPSGENLHINGVVDVQ